MKESIFSSLGFQEAKEQNAKASDFRLEVVENSKVIFSAKDIKCITKCVLRQCHSKKYDNDVMKLYIEATVKNKKLVRWVKLDGTSYKRYKEMANQGIDPSKVCIYELHDPEEEYGNEDKDFTWQVCRIKKDAELDKYGDVSDKSFFKDIPF
jgi:hypothetical protein